MKLTLRLLLAFVFLVTALGETVSTSFEFTVGGYFGPISAITTANNLTFGAISGEAIHQLSIISNHTSGRTKANICIRRFALPSINLNAWQLECTAFVTITPSKEVNIFSTYLAPGIYYYAVYYPVVDETVVTINSIVNPCSSGYTGISCTTEVVKMPLNGSVFWNSSDEPQTHAYHDIAFAFNITEEIDTIIISFPIATPQWQAAVSFQILNMSVSTPFVQNTSTNKPTILSINNPSIGTWYLHMITGFSGQSMVNATMIVIPNKNRTVSIQALDDTQAIEGNLSKSAVAYLSIDIANGRSSRISARFSSNTSSGYSLGMTVGNLPGQAGFNIISPLSGSTAPSWLSIPQMYPSYPYVGRWYITLQCDWCSNQNDTFLIWANTICPNDCSGISDACITEGEQIGQCICPNSPHIINTSYDCASSSHHPPTHNEWLAAVIGAPIISVLIFTIAFVIIIKKRQKRQQAVTLPVNLNARPSAPGARRAGAYQSLS